MANSATYQKATVAYVDSVRALFAPSGTPASKRGLRGPASTRGLVQKADWLSTRSAKLTQVASAQLAAEEPTVRTQAATGLLAKAVTDLTISNYLLKAAKDEERDVAWNKKRGGTRDLWPAIDLEANLRFILAEPSAPPKAHKRGIRAASDLPTARTELSTQIDAALGLVLERAGESGQAALSGLLGLGTVEVAKAAGIVGLDIAETLGQGEKVSRLFGAAQGFLQRAYDSLFALIGPAVAKTVADQVVSWVNELRDGKLFGDLLEKLYETTKTGEALHQLVAGSEAPLAKFAVATSGVEALGEKYAQQDDLAGKLLRGLGFVGAMSAAALPQGRVLLAAFYIVLGGYMILAGADAVDAQRLRLLNRLPGVRSIVETNLVGS